MPEYIKNMYKRESVRKGRFPFVCIAKHVALNGVNSNTLCDAVLASQTSRNMVCEQ